jgi:O-antigen/teichoic acid export membrane protein
MGQLMALAIGLPLLITGGDFILLWMGGEFSSCEILLQILTIPFFFVLPALGFSSFLYAIDKHGLYAKITVTEAIVNLALSLLLVSLLGLPGVALGTLLPGILFRGILLPLKATALADMTIMEYLQAGYLRFLGLAAIHAGILLVLKLVIGAQSWGAFVLNNAIGLTLFCLLTYTFWLESEDKAYIRRRLGI